MRYYKNYNFFVYITTNKTKTTIYTGVTANLKTRLYYHQKDRETDQEHFTGEYNCTNLIYWERHQYILNAIKREKQIKGWTRAKKNTLISEFNPEWKFLNDEI
jgi:putative endonuclease